MLYSLVRCMERCHGEAKFGALGVVSLWPPYLSYFFCWLGARVHARLDVRCGAVRQCRKGFTITPIIPPCYIWVHTYNLHINLSLSLALTIQRGCVIEKNYLIKWIWDCKKIYFQKYFAPKTICWRLYHWCPFKPIIIVAIDIMIVNS